MIFSLDFLKTNYLFSSNNKKKLLLKKIVLKKNDSDCIEKSIIDEFDKMIKFLKINVNKLI